VSNALRGNIGLIESNRPVIFLVTLQNVPRAGHNYTYFKVLPNPKHPKQTNQPSPPNAPSYPSPQGKLRYAVRSNTEAINPSLAILPVPGVGYAMTSSQSNDTNRRIDQSSIPCTNDGRQTHTRRRNHGGRSSPP
jgi:hypothetical protein